LLILNKADQEHKNYKNKALILKEKALTDTIESLLP
jgi:hypothetical protein